LFQTSMILFILLRLERSPAVKNAFFPTAKN